MSASPSNRQGFALLMVILLLALLSGGILQSLVAARITLRAGNERQNRLTLRAAALDAAWAAMRVGLKAGSSSQEYQDFEGQLPSGIHTRTTLRGFQRDRLPPPFRRDDVPLFGQFFSVTTSSEAAGKSCLSRGLACRLPSGDIRLLAWVESP